MSQDNTEHSKEFVQELQNLRHKIEEYDELLSNPHGEPVFDKEFLNLYGRLVRQICDIFSASTFHVFFQVEDDPLLMHGVMTIRESNENIRLQYIRLPIDPLTLAGYTFLKSKVINLTNLYEKNPQYPELQPSRNKEIDRRIKQMTRESLAAPIIDPSTHKPLGVMMVCNQREKQAFSSINERGINALSIIVFKSYFNGVFSRLMPAIQSSGKGGYVTSLLSGQGGEESSLSAEDILNMELAAPDQNKTLDSAKPAMKQANPAQTAKAGPKVGSNAANPSSLAKPDAPQPSKAVAAVKEEEEVEEEWEDEDETEEYEDDEMEADDDVATVVTPLADLDEEDPANYEPYYPDGNETIYANRYDYLIETGKVSEQDFNNALIRAKKEATSLDELLELKFSVRRADIGKSLALHYNLPYQPFNPNFERPNDLLTNIKSDFLEKYKWLPISRESKEPFRAVLVTTDPLNAETNGNIWQMFQRSRTQLMVTTESEFQKYFNRFFTEDSDVEAMLKQLESEVVEAVVDVSQDASISDDELVKLVNRIISDAYARRASDIHIEPYPGNVKTLVRFRIDGELVEYLRLSSALRSRLINRIKIMASLDISDQRTPQDGKIKMSRFMKTLDIELRVATYPVAGGLNLNLEDAVMRVLASGEPVPLEKLGILEKSKARLISAIEKPYGIVFVCGPTGSGKTTTLHSLLKHLNNPTIKIVTAEDPVEITQAGLRQMQIDRKGGTTFASAMRAFLRADPDVIMVGEMRDHETVATGIEASLTGHLVMSTLHTNSAPEAITRLLEMGMDPLNFADAMLAILAQRLTKKLCPSCKVSYEPDPEEVEHLLNEYVRELRHISPWKEDMEGSKKKLHDEWIKTYGKDGKIFLYRAKGCIECNEGYKGRIGLYELMMGSDTIKQVIKRRSQVEEILASCLEDGMDTLKMDGITKVLLGVTDMKQVMIVCIK